MNRATHKRQSKQKTARLLRQRMTPAEACLWQELRANRLGGLHFRRQHVIAGFIVDFFCHKPKLVIEVDGGVHLSQRGSDEKRERILRHSGLEILRFANERVFADLERVVNEIQIACNIRTG